MHRTCPCFGILGGVAALMCVSQATAAVSLGFTNVGTSLTSATVAAGATFSFSVKLTETLSTDQVLGVDYRISSSTNNVFKFLSRNSAVAGEQFTFANGLTDSQLLSQAQSQQILLNPDNGTDLGTSTGSGLTVSGPNTYEVADFSFEVLPNTPSGTYTLSFSSPDYIGGPPTDPTVILSGSSLGTYAVTVPEPASVVMALPGIAAAALFLRRRKQ